MGNGFQQGKMLQSASPIQQQTVHPYPSWISAVPLMLALGCPPARALSVDPEPPLAAPAVGAVQVWLTTNDATKKLQRQGDLAWSAVQPAASFNVAVDESVKYQQMDGFGASITDDAIWTADPAVRDEIMRLLFSRSSGIGMNMIRVPVGSSAITGAYKTHDDLPLGQTDPSLAKFSVAGDLQWKLPMMQRAKALNPELTLMGTPWSAPAWMKDSGALGYGRLLAQYHPSYANYFVKWIQAWHDAGLGISAVTMQNEPHFEPYGYQGMRMDPADQIAFALQLGPAFRNAGLSTRIICWDHNFDEYTYPIEVLDDPDARQWIDGSAFHAYAWDPVNMGLVKAAHPDKNLYFTEQTGSYPGDGFGGSINWHVKNLFMIPGWNFARCTMLWQLGLTTTNLSGDRPFVRVAADGKSYELFGEYYETGHFSKFVRKGAYRIDAATSADGMPRTIAYQNPDGSMVLVALNDSSSAITISIQNNGRWVAYPMAGGSLATLIWRDSSDGNGLAATYFDNTDLTGVTESRIDPTVDFNWGQYGTPDPAIGYAGFSARWTGKLMPPSSETYTFHTTTSDGVRLWVNNQLVIDHWVNQSATETSGSIALIANQPVDVRMEYASVSGTGSANLAWSSPSIPKQTIPRSQLYAPTTATVPPPPVQLSARSTGASVALNWTAAPTATSYTVKRAAASGGPYATVLTSGLAATSYTDSSASAGTTYYYVVSGANTTGSGGDSAQASATPPAALPTPWAHQDIGSVGSTGNAGSINSGLMIASGGGDIWNTSDSCHFAYLTMTGDGTIIARVASQEKSDPWTKSGVMMRESLAANSSQVTVAMTPMQGVHFSCRATTGAATTGTTVSGPFPPQWVKLVRAGTTFTGYNSLNGTTWTQVGSPLVVAMANTIYVGLAVASHSSSGLNITTFDSVSAPGLSIPAPLAPTGVVATAGNASVGLVWNELANATSYNIKRATTIGGPYATIGAISSTTYTDQTALNGTTYYYVITGFNPSGESASSAEVSATPSELLLPKGWVDQDVGAVGFAGGATYASGTFSINGSGADIWGTSDGFNYCYQTVSGDGTVIARVTSVQNTATYAKAAVMFRGSSPADSVNVSMQVSPNGAVYFAYRTATGGASAGAGWTGSGSPKWLKLVRSGTNFSGYYSSNGSAWTQLGATVTIPMASDMLAGLAVSAVNNSALNSSVFDNVGITGFGSPVTPTGLTASPLLGGVNLVWNATNLATSYKIKRATTSGGPYTTVATSTTSSFMDLAVSNRTTYYYVVSAMNATGESGNSGQASATSNTMPVPTGWTDKDIGSVGLPGNADYANGTFTIRGSGADVWNKSDTFNFCSKAVSGNGTIVARVTGLQNTSTSAKAGVMFRETTTNVGARYAFLSVSPGSGIKFEYRTSTGGTAKISASTTGTASVYLKLTRSSNTFKAYYSADGSTWTQLGTASGVTVSMASSAYQGLAVCATNNAALNTATFDNVTALNYQPPATPTGVTATAGYSQVALSWSSVAGATGYYVKRATTSGGPYATMANPAAGSYTDTGMATGTAYYYVISAVTAGAEGPNSSEAAVTTLPPIPAVPAGVMASATNIQVTLNWTAAAGASSYNIKRSATRGGPYATVASSNSTSFTDTALNLGTTYYYTVSAVNAAGESANTAEFAVTPLPPVTQIQLQGGTVIISIATEPGYIYQLQRGTSLTGGNWLNVGGALPGTGGLAQLTHANATLDSAQFYRVEITPPR
jgi:glucosylceramidase